MRKSAVLTVLLLAVFAFASCNKQTQPKDDKKEPAPQGASHKAPEPQEGQPKAEAATPVPESASEAGKDKEPVEDDNTTGEKLWRFACAHMLDINLKESKGTDGAPVPPPSEADRAELIDACVAKFHGAPDPSKVDAVAECMLTTQTLKEIDECSAIMTSGDDSPDGFKPPRPPVVEEKIAGSKVRVETSMGSFVVELTRDATPVTVQNFLRYVKDGFFEGTVFHRVINGFVIQGGGFTADLARKRTRMPIANEAATGLPNERGTIAMARTGQRDSATSQFYVNLRNNQMLNYKNEMQAGWGYCPFGRVVEGMDVVDKIAAVPTGAKGPFPKDVPREAVTINKVIIVE